MGIRSRRRMGITSSWRMIVEVVPGRDKDEWKRKRDRKNHRDEKKHRRRRNDRAPNLLGLSLSGCAEKRVQSGRPDDEALAASEDDDENARWRAYLLWWCLSSW